MKDKNSAMALLIFFISAGGLLCLVAGVCGLASFVPLASQPAAGDSASLNIFFVGSAWIVLLLIPGAVYAIRRIQNQDSPSEIPQPSRLSGWLPFLGALFLYPVVLFLGSQVSNRPELAVWALPFLHILAATIPVYLLSRLALHNLEASSALRRWGVFGLGLVLGPGLIMVVELSLIFLIAIGFVIQLASDQTRAMELMLLAQRIQFAQADPETIFGILRPYLSNPLLPFGVIAFVAGLVPLVEESLKPIGVWLLAGRDLTPSQGFTAGVLSGAGYALFENLFITLPSREWAIVSIGRVGTTTMHLLTAGITGYALVSAWKHHRFLRLGLLFAATVAIHALWNGLTILGLGGTLPALGGSTQWIKTLGQAATGVLVVLYFTVLIGLVWLNRLMRRAESERHAIIPAPLDQNLNHEPELELDHQTGDNPGPNNDDDEPSRGS